MENSPHAPAPALPLRPFKRLLIAVAIVIGAIIAQSLGALLAWPFIETEQITNPLSTREGAAVALAAMIVQSAYAVLLVVLWKGRQNAGLTFEGFKKSWKMLAPLLCLLAISIFLPPLSDQIPEDKVLIALMVIMSLFIGFSEEVIFRGIMVPVFGARQWPLFSILASAVLFGSLHIYGLEGVNAASFFNAVMVTFIVGVPFAIIRLHSNSIIALIVVHGIWDAIALPMSGGKMDNAPTTSQAATGAMFGLCIAAGYLWWHHKNKNNLTPDPTTVVLAKDGEESHPQ